jgi:hypothetical protein
MALIEPSIDTVIGQLLRPRRSIRADYKSDRRQNPRSLWLRHLGGRSRQGHATITSSIPKPDEIASPRESGSVGRTLVAKSAITPRPTSNSLYDDYTLKSRLRGKNRIRGPGFGKNSSFSCPAYALVACNSFGPSKRRRNADSRRAITGLRAEQPCAHSAAFEARPCRLIAAENQHAAIATERAT